jgi:hypothetical protein
MASFHSWASSRTDVSGDAAVADSESRDSALPRLMSTCLDQLPWRGDDSVAASVLGIV